MIVVLLFSFLFGLTVGSFINAAVFRIRWPRAGSLFSGRSCCPRCRVTLPWYDLIPLVSFIALRRRCRFCHKPISWQYPAVELATAALFVAAAILELRIADCGLPVTNYQLPIINYLHLLLACFSIAVLVFLFVFDFRFGLLPDCVTIPAIVIVFFASLLLRFFHELRITNYELRVTDHEWLLWYFLAVVIGAAFFWLQHVFSRGRWVGGGDIRMGALVGAIVGWPAVLIAIALSYFVGSITAILLIAAGRKKLRGDTLPMGPFLAIGTLLTMFFGDRIVELLLYPYRYFL